MTERAHRGVEALPDTTAGRPSAKLAGHNRISTAALTSVARAVAADVFNISAAHVRADWRDDAGLLALSLATPIGVPSLSKVARAPSLVQGFGGSIWDRAEAARSVIRAEVGRLTGSHLSRVDVRITGVRITEGGRVQ